MSFLNFDPYQPDPGGRRPTGPARYIECLFSNLAGLLLTNLLFLLCCLPVVTAGPALVALHKACCLALRGRSASLPGEFWRSFRANLGQGILLGLAALPLLSWLFAACLAAASRLALAPLALCGLFLLACGGVAGYCFLLTAHMRLPLWQLFKNALILFVAGRFFSLAGTAFALAAAFALLLCLPISLPLLFLLGPCLAVYTFCFFGWKVADEYIFIPYYQAHPEQGRPEGYRFDAHGARL